MSRDEALMYLIRHGATANNVAGVLQGRGVDHSLADAGRAQIQSTADALMGRPIKVIYASPLKRAVESAQIIAQRLGLAVEIVDALVEVNVGRWEGLEWKEIARRDATAYEAFINQAGRCGYPDGESYAQVANRVRPVFEELLERNPGRHFAVVAHSVVNRVYLAQLLDLSPDQARRISQSNGCINVVRRSGESTRAITINASIHVA